MTYLILDLETLGTDPGSVITEIGAFFFQPDPEQPLGFKQIGESIHLDVSIISCLQHGLLIDADTILHRARNGTLPEWDKGLKLQQALDAFNTYLTEQVRHHRIDTRELIAVTWGLDFDFPLLRCAAMACHTRLHQPWHFGNQLCARSEWKRAFGTEKAPPRTHRALQDCFDEARDFCKALAHTTYALGKTYPDAA